MILGNISEGMVIAAGCVLAGAVVGVGVGYAVGYDEGVKDTSKELLDFVSMLESEDNKLSGSTSGAMERLKVKSHNRLADDSLDFRKLAKAFGSQTKKTLGSINLS